MKTEETNPLAGKPVPQSLLVDVPRLVRAYYTERPDPENLAERVAFGTSGHRGSSLTRSFNEDHILAITQAICSYRKAHAIDGPLFLGWDTHALSEPARVTALQVLAANGVQVMIDSRDAPTPTPVVSHAILAHNRNAGPRADGIVITPSHNPPNYGGFKYEPPTGGPADTHVTAWIQDAANALLAAGLAGVTRVTHEKSLKAPTTARHDYRTAYVASLADVIDLPAIAGRKLHVGVDPLGGASVDYWPAVAEAYGLDLHVVNTAVDPTFRFMSVDWDGAVRMDPSSVYAMAKLVALRDQYDLAIAADPDADRHGIVCRSAGLLPPNHYLAVSIDYLFRHRQRWPSTAAVGKTVVSSAILDRVAAKLGRKLVEVPVGFKYFVPGLLDGSLGFGGEESAGASFLRLDGTTWTTDKDGIVPGLLALEMTARLGRDPGELYRALVADLGDPAYQRVDFQASDARKDLLLRLTPEDLSMSALGGDPVRAVITRAPDGGQAIGGVRVTTAQAWFAARPSGTEPICKLYAESFRGPEHLARVQEEAQTRLDAFFRARGA